VHSCAATLDSLLKSLPKSDKSAFIFLGDYINKGPSPLDTLLGLLSFSESNQAFFIRGNHDQMLMDAWMYPTTIFEEQIRALGSTSLLSEKKHFQEFFYSTFHFIQSEKFFFVHAGFDFKSKQPFENIEPMMMIRDIEYDRSLAGGRTIIRGHYPHDLSIIRNQVSSEHKIISLDNGCVYPERTDMGNLLAYEVKSKELVVQENIDQM
jgi:serine/threonine protein phosphatase 1